MRIVAVSDLHLTPTRITADRRGEVADLLLERVVHRLNRWVKPDVVVILGDLVDAGESAEAPALWQRLREVSDRLECPSLVLPGNHDRDPKVFYRYFPDPGPVVEVGAVRFLVFLDPEAPGWNAQRTPADLARMAAARGHAGPVVMLQHCSLLPEGTSDCPYHYTNAAQILAGMREHGIALAISGHYHPGVDLVQGEAGSFVVAPALCEPPFAFLEVELDGDRVSVRRHTLRLPECGLVDSHVHTPFAYCAEDLDCARAVSLAQEMGLAGLVFAEHSGQLYFDRETYRRGGFLASGIRTRRGRQERMADYLAAAGRHQPARVGLEVDCDHQGRPVLRASDRGQVAALVGAIHHLPEVEKPHPDPGRLAEQYLAALARFAGSGIGVLAHPFRVFRRARAQVPEWLLAPTVRLLREHGVAAEINYHKQEPEEGLVRLCLKEGVRLALGSDAHALYEVGELWPHLELLRRLGCEGAEVLAEISVEGRA